MITLADRSANYARNFPNWPAPRTDDRWLDTVWVLGNDYEGTGFYGAYPPNYLKRVMTLFPEITKTSKILHLFSGMLYKGQGIHLDIKIHTTIKSFMPDVRGNAEHLPFLNNSFDLIIADPPYGNRDAIKYDVPMPNKRAVFEEVQRVLKIGGHLVWLDTSHPMYRKEDWLLWGLVGVVRSTNHAYRFATIFSRIK